MPEFYRLYTLTEHNKIAGPAQEVTCEDDQEAIRQAKQLLDGHDLQVWQGARLAARLKSKT